MSQRLTVFLPQRMPNYNPYWENLQPVSFLTYSVSRTSMCCNKHFASLLHRKQLVTHQHPAVLGTSKPSLGSLGGLSSRNHKTQLHLILKVPQFFCWQPATPAALHIHWAHKSLLIQADNCTVPLTITVEGAEIRNCGHRVGSQPSIPLLRPCLSQSCSPTQWPSADDRATSPLIN